MTSLNNIGISDKKSFLFKILGNKKLLVPLIMDTDPQELRRIQSRLNETIESELTRQGDIREQETQKRVRAAEILNQLMQEGITVEDLQRVALLRGGKAQKVIKAPNHQREPNVEIDGKRYYVPERGQFTAEVKKLFDADGLSRADFIHLYAIEKQPADA